MANKNERTVGIATRRKQARPGRWALTCTSGPGRRIDQTLFRGGLQRHRSIRFEAQRRVKAEVEVVHKLEVVRVRPCVGPGHTHLVAEGGPPCVHHGAHKEAGGSGEATTEEACDRNAICYL